MSLNATKQEKGGSNRIVQPALEAGGYPVRLVQVIDMGHRDMKPYKGVVKGKARHLRVVYEMVDEFIVDGDGNTVEDKPRWKDETFPFYNLDADLATSTKRYNALDPAGQHKGDWEKLLGAPALLTLSHTKGRGDNSDKIYNNIEGLTTIRKKEADKLPKLVNEPKFFDTESPNWKVFLSLPDWLQDEIKKADSVDRDEWDEEIAAWKKANPEEVEQDDSPENDDDPVVEDSDEDDESEW